MKDFARFFKALSDETRLLILLLLSKHGELCVCDLIASLQLPQSKISRHLATLRHVGLVQDRRAGAWSYYSLGKALRPWERDFLHCMVTASLDSPPATRAFAALQEWMLRKSPIADCSTGQ